MSHGPRTIGPGRTQSVWAASNDLALQLRKRGISRVLLAGMSANLCVEAHLRQMLEDGFEVAVVKDATVVVKSNETVQPILLGSCSFWFRRGWRGR